MKKRLTILLLLLAGLLLAGCARDHTVLVINEPDKHYAEFWNFTPGGFLVQMNDSGIYYNVSGMIPKRSYGLTVTQNIGEKGGIFVTATRAGLYFAKFRASASHAQPGGEYGYLISKNFEQTPNRHCYVRQDGTTATQVFPTGCVLNLSVGDTVNVQFEDEEDPTKQITVKSMYFWIEEI